MARILLHSLTFSPDAVSTSYLMTDLARQLRRLGHTVTVLTTTPHYNQDPVALRRQPMRKRWLGLLYQSQCDGISVWHVKIPMKGDRVLTRVFDYLHFHVMSLIVGYTILERQDVVISPSPPLTIGVIGWLLSKKWTVPSVYNIQELYPDFAINQGLIRNRFVIAFLRWLERFVYARSTAIVPISDWFAKIVRERGVPEEKLRVIPNSVDITLYKPLSRDNPFAREHGLADGFVVLYGGNVGLSQDWESFMQAADRLSDLPIRFVVVGDGVRGKWLAQEVEARKLTNVKLLGYKPRELMPEINASCDICTIPMLGSTTVDTFPSKIYTIMACGRSVIVQADEDSELKWLVTHAGSGRVIPPGDTPAYIEAVRRAYLERSLLAEEGKRARAFVEKQYSTEAVGRNYHDMLTSLIR